MITCGHCGGQHATVSEVRSCSTEPPATVPSQVPSPALPGAANPTRPSAPTSPPSSSTAALAPPAWEVLAGPPSLGRNVVVGPDGRAPAPWAEAERVVIDQGALAEPAELVGDLRDRALRCQATVFELRADLDGLLEARDERPPYQLDPSFSFEGEVLHHLVWANSVDGRDPSRPAWRWRDAALGLGAEPCDDADITLPDGRAAWIDGGALRFATDLDGRAVLHRVAVEHGSLAPFATNVGPATLAPDQSAAVAHPSGGARVIAPAGSGKTRVLTERARLLRLGWHLPASALTLVAFNKRAQEEMRERTADVPGLHVRTLNSLALAVVNGEHPFLATGPRRTTIDEGEVRRILDRLVRFPKRRNVDPVAAWIEALAAVRLGLSSPGAVERSYGGDVEGLAAVFPRYREELARRGSLDFDEQIYAALELLLTNPEARHRAQASCRALLVDEMQDLTPAHMLLLRLLAAPGHAVFGVGDDDQTIYGYNGADPSWLIDFTRWFPGAGDHPLEVNYRCPEGVVTAVDRLLRHNRRRVPKTIRAAKGGGTGWSYVSVAQPLAATVDAVQAALAAGRAPSDIAVLTRVNSLLAPVQVALLQHGVPVAGGVGPEFVGRAAVRAGLAWLRMAVAPDDLQPDDLAEAIRRPARSVSPRLAEWAGEQRSVDGLRRLAARLREPRDVTAMTSFATDLELLATRARLGGTTAELLDQLDQGFGLGRTVATLDNGRQGMNRAAQNDDLEALAALATLEPDPRRFPGWLHAALRRPATAPNGVTLATVHRVKGQEWPVVVLHHVDEQQFPHRLADDEEEERRLFHVALTRTIEQALVVATLSPSPFLAELLEDPPAELLTARRRARPAPAASSARSASKPDRTSAFRKGEVLAVPGQVLVDQGQQWRIAVVNGDEARASVGDDPSEPTTRRVFRLGASVVTVGGRRGRLVAPGPHDPRPAVVIADDRLRAERKRLAAGKPAYTVISDATVEAIALAQPRTRSDLSAIKGIGPSKLDDFGDALLAVVEATR